MHRTRFVRRHSKIKAARPELSDPEPERAYRHPLKAILRALLCIATLLLLMPLKPAHAAPSQEDEVVLGDDLTLRPGEHINGDLVIIGGNLTALAGSRVEGSITALGGRVEIAGTVEGDLVALAGAVFLRDQARIRGDVVALGGRVHRAAGAQTGKVTEGLSIRDSKLLQGLRAPFLPLNGRSDAGFTIQSVVAVLFSAVLMALLGMAVVSFWPAQTTKVGETILRAPLPSLGVGCLLFPLAVSFALIVLITICLSPFAPVVVLLVVAASLFGWIALGTLWGRRLVRWAGWRGATPLAASGVGVFVLTVTTALIGAIPCLGVVLVTGVASIGLGAVALSRFGTRHHRRPTSPPPTET